MRVDAEASCVRAVQDSGELGGRSEAMASDVSELVEPGTADGGVVLGRSDAEGGGERCEGFGELGGQLRSHGFFIGPGPFGLLTLRRRR